LIFDSNDLDAIAAWAATAKPLKGIYYRSVEYRYMDPQEVLSGRGAALYGGRFASVGTRAVFLAESDSAASGEVLARKQRLGVSVTLKIPRFTG
jgi:RES domain-containing protein